MKENDFVSSPYENLFLSSLDDKGRITVPSSLRKKLGLKKNSKFLVSIYNPRKVEKFRIESFGQLKKVLERFCDADEIIFDGSFLIVVGGDADNSN
ncbi:MAG: AbrB/MazE/SpoVT family DNA-binding domain-containing protein [Candidatus Aenigmarchaeota archaeon]|nr:AbrB/MazE/SpoVT family DNA-binding domain-containing protein [Candidatus Aenigmarchaeota archaeon]